MRPLQTGLRSRFDDADVARKIFEKIQSHVPAVHLRRSVEGVTSTLRFVKYEVGAEVAEHPDTAGGDKFTRVSKPNDSLLTCLVYLNEGYNGCETHLEGHKTVPKKLRSSATSFLVLTVASSVRRLIILVETKNFKFFIYFFFGFSDFRIFCLFFSPANFFQKAENHTPDGTGPNF